MASRSRQSTARSIVSRPSAALSSSRDGTDDLPPYKKPSHPLDNDATRSLRELQGKNLDGVKKHTQQATATITKVAESVNDVLREYAEHVEHRQKKWDAGKNLDEKEEVERTLAELQQAVDDATVKLEESMRAVIDSTIAVQQIDETLDWLRQHAPKQLEDEYHTQITQRATQRQSQLASQQPTHDQDGDQDMDADIAAPTPGPTPLDGSRVALTGATQLFTSRMQREKDAYAALSPTVRYARNNEYRDFKGIVNDARHGGASKLSHEDTWFTETGSPTTRCITDGNGGGNNNNNNADNDDDDDDIIVDKATMSTRCPLTYQQFREPYTSTKCPHTFEKNAILDMIRGSVNRIGGRGGPGAKMEKAVECPVNGCSQLLTVHDLRTDPILVRKIQRIQKAEADVAEESSDEDMEEKDEEEAPTSSGRMQVAATQQTIVEDLGDPTDSEEEV